MRCGAKRFLVEYFIDENSLTKEIIARSVPEARKKLKQACQEQVEIRSVILKK